VETEPGVTQGVLAVSTDFVNWRVISSPDYDRLPIHFRFGRFLRLTQTIEGYRLLSSQDGLNWRTRLELSWAPAAICSGRRTFLLTGGRDWIAQSDPLLP